MNQPNMLERYPDSESLSRGLADAEEAAFLEFARIFGPKLRIYFVMKGLQRSDAEALAVSCVSDIALKAHRYQPRPGGSFDAWVFTLARHALADVRRRELATVPLAEWVETADRLEVMEEPSNSAVSDAVWRGLQSLSPADREVIQLRDLEGEQSYSQIGRQLAISEGAARVRHLRATRKLKDLIENDVVIQQLISRGTRRAKGATNERLQS